jgi:UDP-glucuronate 4-epimerase
MKHILVTGCAGYIGSNLTDFLLQNNYVVIGIDNLNDFYSPKIKKHNIKAALKNENFIFYELDLLNYSKVEEVFKNNKIEAIVHLAAYAGVTYSFEDPLLYVRNNLEVTTNLLNMCVKYQVNNFIFASSSSIYGDSEAPFKESMSTDAPLAPYPATKKACEVMCKVYSHAYGINSTIFRFFNPLDIRIRPDLALTKLIRSAMFGEEFPQYQDLNSTGRDYCYLQNMLEVIMHVIENPLRYEIFNLGNSAPVTLGHLVAAVEKVVGKSVNLVRMPERKGEMTLTFADVSKAEKMLGYKSKTPIEFIVDKYYKWFITQEEWYQKGNY